ncbi:hypothetical protein GVAV_000367 [Gurleya vavrai]
MLKMFYDINNIKIQNICNIFRNTNPDINHLLTYDNRIDNKGILFEKNDINKIFYFMYKDYLCENKLIDISNLNDFINKKKSAAENFFKDYIQGLKPFVAIVNYTSEFLIDNLSTEINISSADDIISSLSYSLEIMSFFIKPKFFEFFINKLDSYNVENCVLIIYLALFKSLTINFSSLLKNVIKKSEKIISNSFYIGQMIKILNKYEITNFSSIIKKLNYGAKTFLVVFIDRKFNRLLEAFIIRDIENIYFKKLYIETSTKLLVGSNPEVEIFDQKELQILNILCFFMYKDILFENIYKIGENFNYKQSLNDFFKNEFLAKIRLNCKVINFSIQEENNKSKVNVLKIFNEFLKCIKDDKSTVVFYFRYDITEIANDENFEKLFYEIFILEDIKLRNEFYANIIKHTKERKVVFCFSYLYCSVDTKNPDFLIKQVGNKKNGIFKEISRLFHSSAFRISYAQIKDFEIIFEAGHAIKKLRKDKENDFSIYAQNSKKDITKELQQNLSFKKSFKLKDTNEETGCQPRIKIDEKELKRLHLERIENGGTTKFADCLDSSIKNSITRIHYKQKKIDIDGPKNIPRNVNQNKNNIRIDSKNNDKGNNNKPRAQTICQKQQTTSDNDKNKVEVSKKSTKIEGVYHLSSITQEEQVKLRSLECSNTYTLDKKEIYKQKIKLYYICRDLQINTSLHLFWRSFCNIYMLIFCFFFEDIIVQNKNQLKDSVSSCLYTTIFVDNYKKILKTDFLSSIILQENKINKYYKTNSVKNSLNIVKQIKKNSKITIIENLCDELDKHFKIQNTYHVSKLKNPEITNEQSYNLVFDTKVKNYTISFDLDNNNDQKSQTLDLDRTNLANNLNKINYQQKKPESENLGNNVLKNSDFLFITTHLSLNKIKDQKNKILNTKYYKIMEIFMKFFLKRKDPIKNKFIETFFFKTKCIKNPKEDKDLSLNDAEKKVKDLDKEFENVKEKEIKDSIEFLIETINIEELTSELFKLFN